MTLILGAGAGVVWYFNDERAKKEKEKEVRRNQSAGAPVLGGPFELVDMDGKTRTDKDFAGKWMLIYFGFTFCPDICPEELIKMTSIIEQLDADPEVGAIVQPLFISVDPTRDTPEKVKVYLKEFHPRLIGLTGSLDQVKAVCKEYRVYFSRPNEEDGDDYLVDHSIIMYFMNPDGKYVAYYGQNSTAEQAVASIKKHIREAKAKQAK